MAKTPSRRDQGKPEPPATREGFAGFSMMGRDSKKWGEYRQKLLDQVFIVFEQLADEEPSNSWLREQAKEFGSLTLDFAKAHLRKPGLDAAKVEAEVAKLYAEREKTLAEARKVSAEAREKELSHTIRNLRLQLSMTKALLIGEKSDEAILLGLQVDEMLTALKAVSET